MSAHLPSDEKIDKYYTTVRNKGSANLFVPAQNHVPRKYMIQYASDKGTYWRTASRQ